MVRTDLPSITNRKLMAFLANINYSLAIHHSWGANSLLYTNNAINSLYSRRVYQAQLLRQWLHKIKLHLNLNLSVSLQAVIRLRGFQLTFFNVMSVTSLKSGKHFRMINKMKSPHVWYMSLFDFIVRLAVLSKALWHFLEATLISICVLVIQECWELLFI